MEGEEEQTQSRLTGAEETADKRNRRRVLLAVNCLILSIGNCGGPLISRLYFVNGGHRIWLSCFLQTAGFPIILIPLAVSAIRRRPGPVIQLKPFLFAASTIIGILTGLDDYIYSYGMARLPVSTSSLIIASQLGFTAAFAFFLVRQRFTPFSINSIVLLTAGGCVLALRSGGDRPEGESTRQYVAGFVMTLLAAALYGFILPLMELCYKKGKQKMTYSLVLEIQFVMCFFATAFATVGMIVNNDFQVIPREAREFELGEFKYYMILVWSAIIWQGFFLGAIGVVFCASSLFSAVVIAVLLPMTEVLAVIFFKEKFQAEKGVSLALSLWGFVSYFYGEMTQTKNTPQKPETEIAQLQSAPVKEREMLDP